MGTTLTGTTPQDTYDSLIKVTDNGPLSGTLKALSDGLGNDSTLSLSTTAASIAGTLAVAGDVFIADKIVHTGDTNTAIRFPAADTITAETSGSERLRITSAGNVGIKTTAPAVPLDVVGNIRSSTGILFGTDTAAANALDDYEEGTWTMGVSFGGASVGVTTSRNTGTYTKIGRQVTVNGYLTLTSKGSSTGSAKITGLPFTIANNDANYSAPSLRYENITFANQFQGFGAKNTTTIELNEITILGVVTNITDADFANNSNIMVSFTYFV